MNSKLRKQFTDEIEKIIWTNKISPETLNIAASEYQELQVFDIYLKGADISLSVLKHIDSCIPYPILFIAYKSDEQKAVIAHKEASLKVADTMKVDIYFDTGWQQKLNLELKGRSVDEIYKNYIFQIEPELLATEQTDTKSAIEVIKVKKSLKSQIEALNKKMRAEPSIGKKQELARQRFALEEKLNEL